MRCTVFILMLFFLLPACGKKTTVKGRVYNPVTNEGIEGIKIVVTKPKNSLGYDGAGTKTVFTTSTDAAGNFVIEDRFRKSKTYKMTYIMDLDKYYLIQGEVMNIEAGSNGEISDYPLIPKGKLTENIQNLNCFDQNDIFSVTQYYRPFPNLYGLPSQAIYNGCFSHAGSVNSVPMGWYVYLGTVIKNGISTPFADSIYVTEGGNHVWNINY